MGKRELSKAARFERMFRIWEYLKNNTDSEHPTTQAKMRKSPEVAEFIGDKETFNRLIKDMARALNSDEFGYKEEKDWKIFFRDFQKYYGDHAGEYDEESDLGSAEDDDEADDPVMRIDGLYYNRTFSYDEINRIIEGILAARTLDTKSAAKLIEKVERHLTTKFYKKGPKQICKVMEPELADRELLRNNLLTIQKAIDSNVQISFRFNGYTCRKKLEPVRDKKDMVSPYYIAASGGRYYLLACKEVTIKGETVKNMSIWRIDLMTEVEIPSINEAFGIKGLRRIPKEEVKNLPSKWTEDFQLKHMNMSYDKPVWITLKIKSPKKEDDKAKSIRADYTFLHDWFGDTFKYIGTEKTAPFDDIVKVECSPFAMANWALQYSDRVEVVAPEEVRERVVEKIRKLNKKYGVEGKRMKYECVEDWLNGEKAKGKEPEKYDFVTDCVKSGAEDTYYELDSIDKFFVYQSIQSKFGQQEKGVFQKGSAYAEKNVGIYGKIKHPDSCSELLKKIYVQLWKYDITVTGETMNTANTTLDSLYEKDIERYEKDIESPKEKAERTEISPRQQVSIKYIVSRYAQVRSEESASIGMIKKIKEKAGDLFLTMYHTVGNFIPVPEGCNAPRGTGRLRDYWDLTLACIYNWYKNESDEKIGEYAIEWIVGQDKENRYKAWLELFGEGQEGWNNFVEKNFMQPFVEENTEGDFGRPLELWDGHFEGSVLPTGELNQDGVSDFKQFFANASKWIQSRGELMVKALRENLDKESTEEPA